MSSDEQCEKECPLCMELLEVDDIDFYPCKCGYQICRFCWHRLRTDDNGLCPACRQPYPENPVNFKPLSTSEVLKIKSEKKQKAQQQRNKISESRKHLGAYRVLQKNLVYVVGLSSRVADPDVLKKPEFFGKFGKILKIAVGSSANGPQSASFTAYVTYAKFEDALKAIQSVNNALLDGRTVRASLGTTKYCSSFLRGQACNKPECMYLHSVADSEVSFTKEDMHLGRHTDYERKLIEATLSKDKTVTEKKILPSTFRRKHSQYALLYTKFYYILFHSNSRDRSGTLHTVSSTGALERGYGKSTTHQKQQSRTVSKSRSETPGFGELSNTFSSSEKTVNHIDVPEKKVASKGSFSKLNDGSNKTEVPLNLKENSELPAAAAPVESTKCSKVDFSLPNVEQPLSSANGSRLTEWTSVESDEWRATDNNLKKETSSPVAVTQSATKSNEVVTYAKDTSSMNGFDWQRLLGLNLNDDHPSDVKTAGSEVKILDNNGGRPSHQSAQSDDDLGFDPATESFKGLLPKENNGFFKFICSFESFLDSFTVYFYFATLFFFSSFKAPAPPSSLFTMGQQFGWSSVTSTGDVLHSSIDSTFSLLPSEQTSVSGTNCSSTDYMSFATLRFPAAGQPLPHHMRNVNAAQVLNPYTSKTALMSSQFSDTPPPPPSAAAAAALSSRYSQPKYSFNQSTIPPLTVQSGVVSPGTSQLSEWQEGLKAMLPTVNVRFVPEINSGFKVISVVNINESHIVSLESYPNVTRQSLTSQGSWTGTNQTVNQLPNHQQSNLHNFYTHPSSGQNHQSITVANGQLPILPLTTLSQGAAPQWLLPPPGFAHLSKR
uniref:CCR4-NOT transcription complex subunit 4 n=1 Tax=Syphacia muris TaxID=451379 RepID=A0A0N5AX85_9BILA